MKERLTIEIIDQNNWLIIDNKTGDDANPVDGTANVLKGLVKTINRLYKENEQLKDQLNTNEKFFDDVGNHIQSHKEELWKENEQLKQQIKIFDEFLEGNDLSIDWVDFCGLDECAFENPNFSCKDCIHLKGDVE